MEDRATAHTGASVAVSMTIAVSREAVPADGCSCYCEVPSPAGGEPSAKAAEVPARYEAWERTNPSAATL